MRVSHLLKGVDEQEGAGLSSEMSQVIASCSRDAGQSTAAGKVGSLGSQGQGFGGSNRISLVRVAERQARAQLCSGQP